MKTRKVALVFALTAALCSCGGDLLMSPVGSSSDLEVRLRSLWVVGGLSGNGCSTVVPQIDAFDPVTRTWYPAVASFRSGYERSFAGVAGYDGKIYIIGGFDPSGNVTDTIQIYDIQTGTWSDGTDMTGNRANISAVALDGYIYVLCGSTSDATASWAGSYLTYRYDISDDTWTTRTNYASNSNRSNLTTYFFGGTIFSIGGRSAAATLQTTHDGYVPTPTTTDTDYLSYAAETILGTAKTGFIADVHTTGNGISYLIIVGGVTTMTGTTGSYPFQGTTTYQPTNAVYYLKYPFAYSATSYWNTASAPELPQALGYGAGLIQDAVYYFMGGTNTGTTTSSPVGSASLYYWDLSSFPNGSWSTGPSMPVGRYGHSVVKILSN